MWIRSRDIRESCLKSRRILDDFFALPNFGGGPSKSCTQFITPALWHVDRKKFCEILPVARKLLSLTRWTVISGPKFTDFFSPDVEGVVVNKMLFRSAICGSVPEIFAIKVESCQKSRRILDVFSPSQILGGRPSKSHTHFITPTSRHIAWKRFCGDTPISPEVLVAHTLNFRPNFKFSRLKFFWETPVPVVVCARKAWSICNACKNLRGQHPPIGCFKKINCVIDLVLVYFFVPFNE